MASISDEALRVLGADKALAIGAYGEAVAAYRYLVMAEKAPDEQTRPVFAEMAEEEQDHRQRLEGLLQRYYPESDFYLKTQDKEMVVEGPRLLDIKDQRTFAEAMRLILSTEKKTAAFYAKLSKRIAPEELRALFHELAEEGIDHYQRLERMGPTVVTEDGNPA